MKCSDYEEIGYTSSEDESTEVLARSSHSETPEPFVNYQPRRLIRHTKRSLSDTNLLILLDDRYELEMLCRKPIIDLAVSDSAGFYRVYDDLEKINPAHLIPYVMTRMQKYVKSNCDPENVADRQISCNEVTPKKHDAGGTTELGSMLTEEEDDLSSVSHHERTSPDSGRASIVSLSSLSLSDDDDESCQRPTSQNGVVRLDFNSPVCCSITNEEEDAPPLPPKPTVIYENSATAVTATTVAASNRVSPPEIPPKKQSTNPPPCAVMTTPQTPNRHQHRSARRSYATSSLRNPAFCAARNNTTNMTTTTKSTDTNQGQWSRSRMSTAAAAGIQRKQTFKANKSPHRGNVIVKNNYAAYDTLNTASTTCNVLIQNGPTKKQLANSSHSPFSTLSNFETSSVMSNSSSPLSSCSILMPKNCRIHQSNETVKPHLHSPNISSKHNEKKVVIHEQGSRVNEATSSKSTPAQRISASSHRSSGKQRRKSILSTLIAKVKINGNASKILSSHEKPLVQQSYYHATSKVDNCDDNCIDNELKKNMTGSFQSKGIHVSMSLDQQCHHPNSVESTMPTDVPPTISLENKIGKENGVECLMVNDDMTLFHEDDDSTLDKSLTLMECKSLAGGHETVVSSAEYLPMDGIVSDASFRAFEAAFWKGEKTVVEVPVGVENELNNKVKSMVDEHGIGGGKVRHCSSCTCR